MTTKRKLKRLNEALSARLYNHIPEPEFKNVFIESSDDDTLNLHFDQYIKSHSEETVKEKLIEYSSVILERFPDRNSVYFNEMRIARKETKWPESNESDFDAMIKEEEKSGEPLPSKTISYRLDELMSMFRGGSTIKERRILRGLRAVRDHIDINCGDKELMVHDIVEALNHPILKRFTTDIDPWMYTQIFEGRDTEPYLKNLMKALKAAKVKFKKIEEMSWGFEGKWGCFVHISKKMVLMVELHDDDHYYYVAGPDNEYNLGHYEDVKAIADNLHGLSSIPDWDQDSIARVKEEVAFRDKLDAYSVALKKVEDYLEVLKKDSSLKKQYNKVKKIFQDLQKSFFGKESQDNEVTEVSSPLVNDLEHAIEDLETLLNVAYSEHADDAYENPKAAIKALKHALSDLKKVN